MNRERILLQELEAGVLSRTPRSFERTLRAAGEAGVPAGDVLKALARGLETARARFKAGSLSIPEVLLAVDAFREGVRRLQPRHRKGRGSGSAVRVVIGVVAGDVHDMGKNIVAGVLEASGYPVLDVGRDVSRDAFLDALQKTGAPLLALSGMMSTTLENMREVIAWVRRLFPATGIIAGGAALDESLARSLGADGFAESAAGVPEEARRVLATRGKRPRVKKAVR